MVLTTVDSWLVTVISDTDIVVSTTVMVEVCNGLKVEVVCSVGVPVVPIVVVNGKVVPEVVVPLVLNVKGIVVGPIVVVVEHV